MKLWLSALLLLLLPLSPVAHTDSNRLPELGDASSSLLSLEQEYQMGRAWLRQLRGQGGILHDPVLQEYAENLVYRLASHSDIPSVDLAIVIIQSRDINAFAVPGGVIGLNAGLLLHAENEDEVAAVIAHEIAHVSQRHFVRRYADSQRMNRAVLAAMLASLAVAVAGDAEAGMAGLVASQAAAIQAQLAYSRIHEREADRVGMQTLVNAGRDPHAMPRFFERLQRASQYAGKPPEFLSTHPITEDRIADSRARAERLPRIAPQDSQMFLLMQARVAANFYREPSQGVSHFRNRIPQSRDNLQLAARYGLAISLIRAKQFDEAEKLTLSLIEAHPNQLVFRFLQAQLETERKKPEAAIAVLEAVQQVSPGHYSNSLLLAEQLLKQERYEDAIQLLSPLMKSRSEDPAVWRLAADAWGKSQQLALAHLARAEVMFLNGDNQRAKSQLGFALDYSKQNFPLHSRIRARLREIDALGSERF